MKVLVISDVHLKPWMFKMARWIRNKYDVEGVVCLMDIPDDFGEQGNISLYEETFNEAIQFTKDFPETLWCYGNHDVSYLWSKRESGYSYKASYLCKQKLKELRSIIPDGNLAFIQRIDNTVFCHGGLSDEYVREFLPDLYDSDIDEIIARINAFGLTEMWNDLSPLWYRPQYYHGRMFRIADYVQVVGHTPVESISRHANIVSTDVFSTNTDCSPYGNQTFCIIDTISTELQIIDTPIDIGSFS